MPTRPTRRKNIFANPRYRGKHIIMIAGKVFSARTGRDAAKIFDRVTKKYAKHTPTITYISKEDTLILWV